MRRKVWIVLALLFLMGLGLLQLQRGVGKKAAPPALKPLSISSLPEVDDTTVDRPQTTRPKETAAERRARLISGEGNRDDFKLSGVDIYLYLQKNNSNAVSLITAFEASRDKEFLKIAAERYPNEPMAQAKVLMHDVFPEERPKWIEALKRSSPDNSLPYLLAMSDAVERGDFKEAASELAGARGKTYYDFTAESSQALEEAFVSAGRSDAEAKILSTAEITMPQLLEFRKAGLEFLDEADKSGAAGDVLQQIEYLKANWEMGTHLRQSPRQGVILTDLVGLAQQYRALRRWPPNVPAAFLERPVQEEMAANLSSRDVIRSGTRTFDAWYSNAPDEELVTYLDRARLFGEADALKWLREQHPELSGQTP